MIREPYQVFPYNSVLLNTDTVDNNYIFSFVFSGDVGEKYSYQILQNNNKNNVYVDFSTFQPLKTAGGKVYNNEPISVKVPSQKIPLNGDFIWRLRLVENNGDWSQGNIPTMALQDGKVYEVVSDYVLKSRVAGLLEELKTADFEKVYVSIKSDDDVYKVKNYKSVYVEHLPLSKGGYYLGKVLREESTPKTYYWIRKKVGNSSSIISRSDVGLSGVLLRDATGIYTSQGLLTDEEFATLENSSVNYTTSLYKDAVSVLTANGYSDTTEKVYKLISHTTVGSKKFNNEMTRSSLGLSQYLYIKHNNGGTEQTEQLKNVFTKDEILSICGDFKEPSTSFGQYSVVYEKIENDEQYKPVSCYKILETSFEEDSEQILYQITQNTTSVGSLTNNEEIEESKELLRSQVKDLDGFLLARDQNGNIFSTYNLFTEEEKNKIIDSQIDYGFYEVDKVISGDLLNKDIVVYKNFYDSNYYFFKTRQVPLVTFINEFGDRLVEDGQVLNSRYSKFSILEKDNINTKCFEWKLFREDSTIPEAQSGKVFSRDISFEYGDFLNNFSYRLELKIETLDGAALQYSLTNITAEYSINTTIKSTAEYNKESECIDVTWPIQKLSVPDHVKMDGDNSFTPDQDWGATKIGDNSSLLYKTISGENIQLDPKTFLATLFFQINEKVRNSIKEEEIIRFYSNPPIDSSFSLFKRYNNLLIKCLGKEILLGKVTNLETFEINNSTPLTLLNEIHKIDISSLGETDKYSIYLLPDTGTLASDTLLAPEEVDLSYTRFKVFITQKKILVSRFRKVENQWYYIDSYGINNENNEYFTLPNYYLNNVQINGPIAIKYLEVFEDKDLLEFLGEQNQQGFYPNDYQWEPNYTDSTNKILAVNFSKSYNSTFDIDENDEIIGYQIYRDEYDSDQKRYLISTQKIADVLTTELVKINNNSRLRIKDYSFHNRGYFEYEVIPKIQREEDQEIKNYLGKAIVSNLLYVNNYYWLFTGLSKRENGFYKPNQTWKFILNLGQGAVVHNQQKVFHTGNSKYPKMAVSGLDYITTTLSTLVGNFKTVQVNRYNGELLISEKITYPTSINNLRRIFIKESPSLKDANFLNDSAILTVKGQSSKIINYGDVLMDGMRYYYVEIETPFKDLIPYKGLAYDITLIKDKNNSNNYQHLGEYNTYEDTISIINEWNDFTVQQDTILVKDIKGNIYIASISNNQENYNLSIDQMPTTVNFQITQIGAAADYPVFDY